MIISILRLSIIEWPIRVMSLNFPLMGIIPILLYRGLPSFPLAPDIFYIPPPASFLAPPPFFISPPAKFFLFFGRGGKKNGIVVLSKKLYKLFFNPYRVFYNIPWNFLSKYFLHGYFIWTFFIFYRWFLYMPLRAKILPFRAW